MEYFCLVLLSKNNFKLLAQNIKLDSHMVSQLNSLNAFTKIFQILKKYFNIQVFTKILLNCFVDSCNNTIVDRSSTNFRFYYFCNKIA